MKERMKSILYTVRHRRAFLIVEKKLLGHNTIRGYFHDLDKVFLKLFLKKETAQKIHRKYSRHHARNASTKQDYIQMIIDWECARYTKPDKPLNAKETLFKFYPELAEKVLPILKEFNL